MRKGLLALLPVLVLAIPAQAASVPSKPLLQRTDDTVPVGLNDQTWLLDHPAPHASWDELGASYRDLGAKIVRFGVDWKVVEGTPGRLDLNVHVRAYQRLRAQGLRPLVIVSGAPRWAARPEAQRRCDWARICRTYPAPEHVDAWRRFVAEVVRAMPEAIGIEVFNEPNLPAFWDTTPGASTDARTYVQLLRAAHAGVKEVDPTMPVVGGALANGGYGPGATPLKEYLSALLDAGAVTAMDALSFHPYPFDRDVRSETSGFTRTMAEVRAALGARGLDGRLRLWVTEMGMPTVASPFSDADQAAALADLLAAVDAMADVDLAIFHTLVDPCADSANLECGYGLALHDRGPDGLVKRAAWGALRDRHAALRAAGRAREAKARRAARRAKRCRRKAVARRKGSARAAPKAKRCRAARKPKRKRSAPKRRSP